MATGLHQDAWTAQAVFQWPRLDTYRTHTNYAILAWNPKHPPIKYVWGTATGVCFPYDTRLRFLVEGKDEGKGAPMACAMIYF